MTIATPLASATAAISAAFKLSSSQPERILSVTGIDTSRTTALKDFAEALGPPHQLAAATSLDDLRHGAAAVDVQHVRAALLDESSRAHHAVHVRAEDLNSDRALLGPEAHHAETLLALARQRFDADELGEHEPDRATARAPHDAAKRRIGHSRHGRENEPRPHLDRPDA